MRRKFGQHRAAVLIAAAGSVVAGAGASKALGQIRAFPEAEGFGAMATGAARVAGTAASVYHVTNLNNSGTGSFRDAVSVANRIVVFDIGGVITLTSEVAVKSNITIAGQTAPGSGIMIIGKETSFGSQDNIIARYMRLRPGDTSGSNDNGLNLFNAGNVIVDHFSIQFANYNNIDAVTDTGNITVQNSIIADPIGQQFVAHTEGLDGGFSWSNNLLANSHNRTPLAKFDTVYKNNVNYNYDGGYTVSDTGSSFKHDVVGNYFIDGPAVGTALYDFNSKQSLYVTGNLVDTNRNGSLDGSTLSAPSGTTALAAPWSSLTAGLPTVTASQAFTFVTTHAGASIDRDDLDDLVVSQVKTYGNKAVPSGTATGTAGPDGGMYHHASNTGLTNGGLGTLPTVTRDGTFDTDKDGIADTWEAAHGLSSSVASDSLLKNPLGYLMVEQYINELGSTNDSKTWTASSGAWGTGANWTSATVPSGVPLALEYAFVKGTSLANGAVTLSTGTATAMTLDIGGGGSPAAGESMTVSTGGTLNVYDTITVGDANHGALNITGGTVSAWNVQLGTTVWNAGVSTTYNGTLNLSAGVLKTAQIALGGGKAGNWNTGGSILFTGGTIQASGALVVNAPIAVSGAGGVVDTNGQTVSFSGVVSSTGGLYKTGNGILTLSGSSTNTGATTIRTGVLAVSALTNAGVPGPLGAPTTVGGAPEALVLDGGTLRYAGPASGATDRAFTVTNRGGTIDAGTVGPVSFGIVGNNIVQSGTGNRTLTLTGSINNSTFNLGLGDPTSGKTSLTINGATTAARWFVAASTTTRSYSGDTTVNQGTLFATGQNILPSGTGKGNLVINTGGVFEMAGLSQAINGLTGVGVLNSRSGTPTLSVGNGNASTTFSGTLSGSTRITKVGTGMQTFAVGGTYSYTGATTISGGILAVNAPLLASTITIQAPAQLQGTGPFSTVTVNTGGTLAPGNSIGSMDFTGSVTVDGTLAIEVNGNGALAGLTDLIKVTGTLDLTGGSLSITTVAGGTAPNDPAYIFATYGTLAGTFTNVTLPAGYALNYAYNNGTSTKNIAMVAVVPEPGVMGFGAVLGGLLLGRRRRRD